MMNDTQKCPETGLKGPTGRCLADPGFVYVPSYQTNLRARFQLHGWIGPEELGKFADPYERVRDAEI